LRAWRISGRPAHDLRSDRSTGDPTVLLLPAFDPYTVASTRRLEHIGAAGHKADVSRPQGWISATLVINGWIRGVWETGDGGRPAVTPFGPLPPRVRRHLHARLTGS
jgi:DNA glycosylase AlkZ-like